MAGKAVLAIQIISDATKAARGFQVTETRAERMGRRIKGASRAGAVALTALVAAGSVAAKAAAEDAQSQQLLAVAMRNSANATATSIAATERWIDKTARATGVADDQLRPALGTLVRATGSAAKAQKSLSLALDVSAATGKPVQAVAAALAKGYGGQTTALGRLVPGMDKAILKSGDMKRITAELARTTGGSMAKAADTEAGKMQRAQVARDEAVESIGQQLLPLYESAATALDKVATAAGNNETAFKVVAIAIASVAVATIAVNAAYKVYLATQLVVTAAGKAHLLVAGLQTAAAYAMGTAWLAVRVAVLTYTTAQWALNAALTANPVGVVIAAIAILVGLVVLAYKKSSTFRSIVQAAGRGAAISFGWVVAKARDVWNWIKKLGPVASTTKRIVVTAFKAYLRPIQWAIDKVSSLIGWIKRIKFPQPPKWVRKLFGGGGGEGGAPTGGGRGGRGPHRTVPAGGRGGPGGPGMGGLAVAGYGYGSGVTVINHIHIDGKVLDPAGTADALAQLLSRRAKRRGR